MTLLASVRSSRHDEDTDLDGATRRPRLLRLAPAFVRRKPRLAYVAVVIVGLGVIVASQLALSIGLSNGAYEISSLQGTQKDLSRTNQELTEQVQQFGSPQYLAQKAESLGMVVNGSTVFLRLSDGAILGSPVPASIEAAPFTNGAGGVVPNALLAGAPAAPATQGTPGTTGTSVTPPSAPATPPADPRLPWQGALPSPTTR